jgi:hypothetical protein
MRDRHLPRVCRHCQGPMARQDDACWRCGTQWETEATEDAPGAALQVLPGGAPDEARLDEDRWFDEGGGSDRQITGPPRVASESR